jgi:hypothetical protein
VQTFNNFTFGKKKWLDGIYEFNLTDYLDNNNNDAKIKKFVYYSRDVYLEQLVR